MKNTKTIAHKIRACPYKYERLDTLIGYEKLKIFFYVNIASFMRNESS